MSSLARLIVLALSVMCLVNCTDTRSEEVSRSHSPTHPPTPAGSSTVVPDQYWVEIRQDDVWSRGIVTVNGFPVDDWVGRGVNQSYDLSINTALIGKGNELSVRNEPLLRRMGRERLRIEDVEMHAWVTESDELGFQESSVPNSRITKAQVDSAHAAWSERAQAQWQAYLAWEEACLASNPDSTAVLSCT